MLGESRRGTFIYSGSFRSPPELEEVEDDEERDEVEEEKGLAAPEGSGLEAFLSELLGEPEAGPGNGVWEAGGDWLAGRLSAWVGLSYFFSLSCLPPESVCGGVGCLWRLLDLDCLLASLDDCHPEGDLFLSGCGATSGDGDFFSLRKVMSMCMGGMTSLNLSSLTVRRLSCSGPGKAPAGVAVSALDSSLTGDAATLLRGEARRGSGVEEGEDDWCLVRGGSIGPLAEDVGLAGVTVRSEAREEAVLVVSVGGRGDGSMTGVTERWTPFVKMTESVSVTALRLSPVREGESELRRDTAFLKVLSEERSESLTEGTGEGGAWRPLCSRRRLRAA